MHLTSHAEEQLDVRKIPKEIVLDTVRNPQQQTPTHGGRQIRQSQYFDPAEGKVMLIRVIIEHQDEDLLVVSVYKTSRIEKYWLEE